MVSHVQQETTLEISQMTDMKRKKQARQSDSPQITVAIRLPVEVDAKLDQLSMQTGKTRSRLTTEALIAHALPQLEQTKGAK